MPTNRYGNRKPTKDGQSREMRQRMAEGRRARGERGIRSAPSQGRQVTTNYTSNNVNSLRGMARDALKMLTRLGVAASVFEPQPAGGSLSSQGIYPGYEKIGPQVPQRLFDEAKEARRAELAMSFDRAFAAARRAGKQTFEWRDKLYTTELADD